MVRDSFLATPEYSTQNEQKTALTAAENIFRDVPLAYKHLAVSEDFLTVMGGIKVATDLSFVGDTYNKAEYDAFAYAIAAQGLRTTELVEAPSPSGMPRMVGKIYNPQTLARDTADGKLALPYNANEGLDEWFNRCLAGGGSVGVLSGIVYSFPRTAIKDFYNSRERPVVKHVYRILERAGIKKSSALQTGNETYMTYKPSAPDIVEREAKKQDFLAGLQSSPRFTAMISSQALKDSKIAWRQRLPAHLRINNSSQT